MGQKILVGAIALLCYLVAVASAYLPATCTDPSVNQLPFCNASLSLPERVDDLIPRIIALGNYEIVAQMVNEAKEIRQLQIPYYNWWTECLHGVIAVNATSFPQVIGLGATFNTSLWLKMAIVISTEARALYQDTNQIQGLNFFAENYWLAEHKDPRWGRGQETPGEDPFLSSQYVMNYVAGLQGHPEDPYYNPKYTKISATCKHFDAYSLEDWHNVTRYEFNAIVNDQDFSETYLPVFRACVQNSHVKSIMCSYNAVNGVPSCANYLLNNIVARNEWGLTGFIVSDCGAIDDIQTQHNFTETIEQTCRVAIGGGTDLCCGNYYKLCAEFLNKTISMEEVQTSLGRLFTSRMELGLFDPPSLNSYTSISADVLSSPPHRALALEAAIQSIVLLKNENNILPIAPNKSIAVIGPNANNSIVLLGDYYGTPVNIVTILEGISTVAKNVTYAEGCGVQGTNTSGFTQAIAIAQKAEIVVMVMGLDQNVESEGKDRVSLTLPGVQGELIRKVFEVNKNIVLVLINGGPVAIEGFIKDNVPGIIEAFYPGEAGGAAVADVIFGHVSPAGRLPYTMYPEEYVIQQSMFNMDMRTPPGRTYRFYTGEPVYPFGYGLSYTTFSYKYPSGRPEQVVIQAGQETQLEFRVVVKNIGKMDSDLVVLAVFKTNITNAPMQTLFGFKRVHLKVNQTTEVFFFFGGSEMALNNSDGSLWIKEGRYTVFIGDLPFTVDIIGNKKIQHSYTKG